MSPPQCEKANMPAKTEIDYCIMAGDREKSLRVLFEIGVWKFPLMDKQKLCGDAKQGV